MDYYLLLTPFFAIILVISLYVLKRTLAQLSRVSSPPLLPSSQSELSYLNTFAYMVKQMTWLQPIFAPIGKLQAPTLFSLSFLVILSYYFPQCYAFGLIGPFVHLIFMAFRVLNDEIQGEGVDEETQRSKATKFYMIFECLGIVGYAYLLGVTFRNYLNSELQSFMITAIVNVGIEQAIASPLIYGLIAIALCRSSRVCHYISCQNPIIETKIVNQHDYLQQGPRILDQHRDRRQQSNIMLFQEPSCEKIVSADEHGRQEEQSQHIDDYQDIISKDEGEQIEKGTYCLNLRKESIKVDKFNHQLLALDHKHQESSGEVQSVVSEHENKRPPLQETNLNLVTPLDYFPAEPELLFEINECKTFKAARQKAQKIKSTRKLGKNQNEICIDQQMEERPSTRQSKQENLSEALEPKRMVTNKTSNVLKIRKHEILEIEELDGAENIFDQDVRRRRHHRRETAMTLFQDRSQKNRSQVSILSGEEVGRKLLRRGRKRRGRDKPIVHEGEEKPEFFIANFE